MADQKKDKKVAPKIKDLAVPTKTAKELKGGVYYNPDAIQGRAAGPRRSY